jgi:hypothetical protein
MQFAGEPTKTCWGMNKVTATGLAPEIVWFQADDKVLQPNDNKPPAQLPHSYNSEILWKKGSDIKPADAHNLQRPETVECLFMMWRITKDPIYREWGWEIFKAFREHCEYAPEEGCSPSRM